jgi:hypothetical protein
MPLDDRVDPKIYLCGKVTTYLAACPGRDSKISVLTLYSNLMEADKNHPLGGT